jgi:hypothetical protein
MKWATLQEYRQMISITPSAHFYPLPLESGSERIPRSVLRGKRASGEYYYSLGIEDSP